METMGGRERERAGWREDEEESKKEKDECERARGDREGEEDRRGIQVASVCLSEADHNPPLSEQRRILH